MLHKELGFLFVTHIVVLLAKLYPVVVDPALIPQGDAPLARRGLRLSHQEAPVDARGEKVLGRIPRDGPVVPGVLLQRVDWGDVVRGHPAHVTEHRVGLAPFTRLVIRENSNLKIASEVNVANLRQFDPI